MSQETKIVIKDFNFYYAAVKPLSLFEVSELDSPFARTPGARFGAHQFHERMTGTLGDDLDLIRPQIALFERGKLLL